jgi:choline dehydrogenase-like flavoprotein
VPGVPPAAGGRDIDLLVVGGGIIGTSCAYHLSRTGWKVTILDRGESARILRNDVALMLTVRQTRSPKKIDHRPAEILIRSASDLLALRGAVFVTECRLEIGQRDFAPFSIQIVGERAEAEGKTHTSPARKFRDRPCQKPNPRILEIITKLFPAVFHIQLKGVQKTSDLHLSTNNPPMLRINGDLVRVDYPPMQNDDFKAWCMRSFTISLTIDSSAAARELPWPR